jgi:hypothetical protein
MRRTSSRRGWQAFRTIGNLNVKDVNKRQLKPAASQSVRCVYTGRLNRILSALSTDYIKACERVSVRYTADWLLPWRLRSLGLCKQHRDNKLITHNYFRSGAQVPGMRFIA